MNETGATAARDRLRRREISDRGGARRRRRRSHAVLIGIVGAADPAIEAFAHVWLRIGQLGKLFAILRAKGVADVALIGGLTRPELADLRLDWGAIKRLPELAQAFRGGDNHLLAGIAAIFEREGLNVVGAHEIAPRLLAPLGPIGARAAAPQAEADIRMGAALIAALSPFDAGQGVVDRQRPRRRGRGGRRDRRDAGARRRAA